MQRARTWLGREPTASFVLLVIALLAVLLLLAGIIPSTIGGWSVRGGVFGLFGAAVVQVCIALWRSARRRRARTSQDRSGTGD